MDQIPFTLKKDAVYRELAGRLERRFYAPGERLPNEKAFADELGVGVITLRPALKRLEEEGWLIRQPGKGTFVAPDRISDKVLVVVTRKEDPSNTANYILPGIESELARRGLTPEIAYFQDLRKLGREEALEILRQKRLRGMLLITSSIRPDDPEMEYMRRLNLPSVFLHPDSKDLALGIACVHVDIAAGWKKGLDHLFQQGFRRIRIIAAPQREMRGCSVSLLSGYGVENPEQSVYASAYAPDAIRATVDRMLQDGAPDAIYCYSDFYAVVVMEHLQRAHGLRIPEDIAVMGYCGYPGRSFLSPPLSTVDCHYRAIGEAGVRLLCSSAEWFGRADLPVPQIELPCDLDVRDSTVRCRKKKMFSSLRKGVSHDEKITG